MVLRFSRRCVAAELMRIDTDPPMFGAEESEILKNALGKTPHINTNTIWLVMDHVRTGQ